MQAFETFNRPESSIYSMHIMELPGTTTNITISFSIHSSLGEKSADADSLGPGIASRNPISDYSTEPGPGLGGLCSKIGRQESHKLSSQQNRLLCRDGIKT